MKDPFFAAILMKIEGCIHDDDRATRATGLLVPKDSGVKSAMRKAELAMGGKMPAKKPEGAEEEWVAALSGKLVEIGRELVKEGGLPAAHFVLSLKAAQDSLATRREMAGHSRGYLDFLEGFMKDARGGA